MSPSNDPQAEMESYRDPTSHARLRSNNSTGQGISLLIYSIPPHYGQGTGNIISGILAAVLFGEEFGRTVCIEGSSEKASFDSAFRWRDVEHGRLCDEVLTKNKLLPHQQKQQQTPPIPRDPPSSETPLLFSIPPMDESNTIRQNNFDSTAIQSECAMKDILGNHNDYPVLYYTGNTYPRWPVNPSQGGVDGGNGAETETTIIGRPTPRNIFEEYFEPTPSLLGVLPWMVDNPPAVVVHLRQGDDTYDKRDGLDEQTLSLLASYNFSSGDVASSPAGPIPSPSRSIPPPLKNDHVFLVTNQVGWYERFSQWSHPPWSLVHHSAQPKLVWGGPQRRDDGRSQQRYLKGSNISSTSAAQLHQQLGSPAAASAAPPTREEKEKVASLQMWSDWYTLLNAQRIYHTHSDFSLSAARWNQNIVSWTIRGVEAVSAATRNGTVTTMQADNVDSATAEGGGGGGDTRNYRLVLGRDFDDIIDPVRRLVDRTETDLLHCDPSKQAAEIQSFEDTKFKQSLDMLLQRRHERFHSVLHMLLH
jgi:hypothetical protein